MAVEIILQWLASLTALVGVAPAFFYLDPLVQAGISGALVTGFISDRRKGRLLPPLPTTLLLFLCFFFYLSQMSLNNVVNPLVNMLVLLLAVRLVTEKTGRHLLQIFVLATFILAASSLLSLSILYLGALALLVVLVTFGLLLTSFHVSSPALCLNRKQWKSLLLTGSILPLGSLLLMLFFFTILPRTEHPLWNFLNPATKPTAGFSEKVSPGSLANLGTSGQPAFRVQMTAIDPQDLYWRGLVLNQIDGRNWARSKTPPADKLVQNKTPLKKQTIFSEPRSDPYLPGLDLPTKLAGIKNYSFADGVFESRQTADKSGRYTVYSTRSGYLKLENPQSHRFYLQVPAQIPTRVAKIAADIAREKNRALRIAATRDFFIRQQLSYAASNLRLTATPVDTFLFESKRGYCEYFAASFALLLRLADVPSRLVGGYLGGRYNELGDYYLIDEDMAHVWVEALDDTNRWQRIDPSRLAVNASEAVTGLSRRSFSWTQATSDYLLTAWNQMVITYDLQKQLGLFLAAGRNLNQFRINLPGRSFWWLTGGGLLLIILATKLLFLTRQGSQHLLQRYLRQIKKSADLQQVPTHLGLFALAELSNEPLCHKFARIYGGALYRDQDLNAQQRAELHHIIHQLAKRRLQISLTEKPPQSFRQ